MIDKPNDLRVSMAQVFKAVEYANDHPDRYLSGTTNWCAAVAFSLNRQIIADAQPATAKVDERAEFEAAVKAMGLSLHNPATGKYWQYIRCGWMMWQARANLEIK